jgi:uncharacterized membrane protein YhhN
MGHVWKFTILYAFIVIVVMIGYFLDASLLLYFVKPFIVLSLGYFYFKYSSKSKIKKVSIYYYLGLFFSLIGDVLFIGDLDKGFIVGMSSYLLMHLFYMRIFRAEGTLVVFKDWKTLFVVLPVLLFIFLFFGYFILQKAPIEVFILSGLYTFVVTSIFLLVFLRKSNRQNYIYGMIMIVLFMTGSTIIGYQKFALNQVFNQLIIIPIYTFGQYFMLMTIHTYHSDYKRNR